MASAGAILLPEVRDAAAHSVHHGYTYTERICQEYGQQPRWYQVRDPIAGSDWRNDGGWTIVLERGGGTLDTYELAPGAGDYYIWQGNYIQITGNRWILVASTVFRLDPGGAYVRLDGRAGWEDGDPTPNLDFGLLSALTRYHLIPGAASGQYIRWANMQWCR